MHVVTGMPLLMCQSSVVFYHLVETMDQAQDQIHMQVSLPSEQSCQPLLCWFEWIDHCEQNSMDVFLEILIPSSFALALQPWLRGWLTLSISIVLGKLPARFWYSIDLCVKSVLESMLVLDRMQHRKHHAEERQLYSQILTGGKAHYARSNGGGLSWSWQKTGDNWFSISIQIYREWDWLGMVGILNHFKDLIA